MIKSRMQVLYEILVRPAWKWLILAPLAILRIFQSISNVFFSSDARERYKLLKGISHFSIAWYITITLVLVLIIVLESAYRSILKRELQLKIFLDENEYSLQLVRVDQEDRREKDKNAQIVNRHMRFLFRFRNTLNRPIQYSILNLVINGVSQQNPLSKGGVIAAHGETTFYSHFLSSPVDGIGSIYNAISVIEITYGPAGRDATRKIYKKIHLECINDQCNMLYEKDTDKPLDD